MQRRDGRPKRRTPRRRTTASWGWWLTRLGAHTLMLASIGCAPVPELVISTPDDPTTTEAGGTATIAVRLGKSPNHPVKVRAESSDPSEGEVSGELWFDRRNWSVPQYLTVRGVDDPIRDGDVPYEIRVEARPSSDPADEPYLVEEVALVNEDDDGASLLALGDLPTGAFASEVIGVSDDGDVIVGNGTVAAGPLGFRWTAETGMQPVPGSTGITGISPNGHLILGGEAATDKTPFPHYLVWTDGEPPRLVAPAMSEPSTTHPVVLIGPSLVLDDGYVFGSCLQYGGHGQPFGCRVDPAGGFAPFGSATWIRVVDLAGNYGGGRDGDRLDPMGTRAILNGEVLGTIRGCEFVNACTAEVVDFSVDARVTIGNGLGQPTGHGHQQLVPTAFVHTAADPMRPLPDLPGGLEASAVHAISDDGAIIGGLANDEHDQHAVLWIDGQPRRLAELLVASGAKIPTGYRLLRVTAMSADGRVLAGNAVNPRGDAEAFRAILPRNP